MVGFVLVGKLVQDHIGDLLGHWRALKPVVPEAFNDVLEP
jgi:hypothetical protein